MDRSVSDNSGLSSRLLRLLPSLVCPTCRGDLALASGALECASCARVYSIRSGRIYFVDVPSRTDDLDHLKGWLKRRLGRFYYTIGVAVVAPDHPFDLAGKIRQDFDPGDGIVVNIGCGNDRIDPDVIGLDLFDYDAVDLVCDIASLPFRDGSVDAVASRSVLEHVRDLEAVTSEIRRCTKPEGWSFHGFPFLYPFHASPDDYWRFTHAGFEALLPGFDVVEETNTSGPATLWLVCTIEFLSILLSGGSARVKSAVTLLLCGLLFPIKYVDRFFIDRPAFRTIAPNLLTVLRKR